MMLIQGSLPNSEQSPQVVAQGRKLEIPRCAQTSQVAWFTFSDLCNKALGAADYLAVGNTFHTVFMADIPRLTLQERDQVRRFITFIDAMYERNVRFVCTAETNPKSLFYLSEAERKTCDLDEVFAWNRTASRLMEMQSKQYLNHVARSLDAKQFLGQFEISALTEEDCKELWRRYDQDDNGVLDPADLRFLLEDLLDIQQGHRNVSDELLEACREEVGTNKDGVVSFEEFHKYLDNLTTVQEYLEVY